MKFLLKSYAAFFAYIKRSGRIGAVLRYVCRVYLNVFNSFALLSYLNCLARAALLLLKKTNIDESLLFLE